MARCPSSNGCEDAEAVSGQSVYELEGGDADRLQPAAGRGALRARLHTGATTTSDDDDRRAVRRSRAIDIEAWPGDMADCSVSVGSFRTILAILCNRWRGPQVDLFRILLRGEGRGSQQSGSDTQKNSAPDGHEPLREGNYNVRASIKASSRPHVRPSSANASFATVRVFSGDAPSARNQADESPA